MIERLVQNAAYELGMDPADIRKKNFIEKDQFPYESATGFVYTRATTARPWTRPSRRSGTRSSVRNRRSKREDGKLWGIGLASFTEVVGAGPHKDYDILGLKMNGEAELRSTPRARRS